MAAKITIMNFLFKKTLHIFYILILLGIFINKDEPFTPQARVAHSSILVGNKLYYFVEQMLVTILMKCFILTPLRRSILHHNHG